MGKDFEGYKKKRYSTLVGERLGIPVDNCGISAAGQHLVPLFFNYRTPNTFTGAFLPDACYTLLLKGQSKRETKEMDRVCKKNSVFRERAMQHGQPPQNTFKAFDALFWCVGDKARKLERNYHRKYRNKNLKSVLWTER